MKLEPLVTSFSLEPEDTLVVTILEARPSALIPPVEGSDSPTIVHPDAVCKAVQDAALAFSSPVRSVKLRFGPELAKNNAGWDFDIRPDGKVEMTDAIPPQSPPVFSISEMRNDPVFPSALVDQAEALCRVSFLLCFGDIRLNRPTVAEGSD